MDFRSLILVFQSDGNELVRTYDTVYEVRTALDHTLVDKLLERLVLTYIAQVIEELVPETGVNQMARSMLCTTDIEIDIPPVFVSLAAHELLIVMRVHVSQIVSAGTCKAWHCAGFQRITVICPVLRTCKRRLSALGRLELVDFRKGERKFLIWQRCRNAILIIYRERLSPISLT